MASHGEHVAAVAKFWRARRAATPNSLISLTLITLLTISHATSSVGTNESQPQNVTTATATGTAINTTPSTTSTFPSQILRTNATPTTTSEDTKSLATTTASASTSAPVTLREPTEQEINEARKIIQEVASTIKVTNPHRMIMNRPPPSSLQMDYAPDSLEARISDATTHFGLSLMRQALKGSQEKSLAVASENTVLSPLSLQILMNIILLGTKDQSSSQLELAKALGYDEIQSMSLKKQNSSNVEQNDLTRLHRPHEAMHSLLDSIMKATHLSVDDRHLAQQLLNSPSQSEFEAHLSTTNRDNDTPLSGQLNFTLANLMLTNRDLLQTSADYEKELTKYYNIKVEQFGTIPMNSTAAAVAGENKNKGVQERPLHERVNEWVKNVTQNQITNLVDSETLNNPLLALVLINAAHFKGQWLHTFNTRLTEERTFYNNGKDPRDTKFMRQNGAFGYAEFNNNQRLQAKRGRSPLDALLGSSLSSSKSQDDGETVLTDDGPAVSVVGRMADSDSADQAGGQESNVEKRINLTAKLNCSALLMPFSLNDGQEMSMVVLLPSERDGLDQLIKNLDASALNEIYRVISADTQQVQVELPKFSIEAAHDVKSLLKSMGVERIFSKESAELERMFGKQGASSSVDKVIHKAKIAVDEQGAEAAAASLASVVMRSSIRVTIPTFTADHPFLYIIRHSRSNMPLFMGQVRSFQ